MRWVGGGFCILLGVGLISLALLSWSFYLGKRSEQHARSQWPTVQGTIISSEVYETNFESGPLWKSKVRFVYELAGLRYSGKQTWVVAQGDFGKKQAQKALLDYSPGATVPVYYNSANPGEAVVKPEGRSNGAESVVMVWGSISGVAGLLAFCFGIWVLILYRVKTITLRRETRPRG